MRGLLLVGSEVDSSEKIMSELTSRAEQRRGAGTGMKLFRGKQLHSLHSLHTFTFTFIQARPNFRTSSSPVTFHSHSRLAAFFSASRCAVRAEPGEARRRLTLAFESEKARNLRASSAAAAVSVCGWRWIQSPPGGSSRHWRPHEAAQHALLSTNTLSSYSLTHSLTHFLTHQL